MKRLGVASNPCVLFSPPLCVSPALPGSSAPTGTGEGGGTDSFVLFAGSKQSGKSSLVTQFLNPSKEVGGCGGCCPALFV